MVSFRVVCCSENILHICVVSSSFVCCSEDIFHIYVDCLHVEYCSESVCSWKWRNKRSRRCQTKSLVQTELLKYINDRKSVRMVQLVQTTQLRSRYVASMDDLVLSVCVLSSWRLEVMTQGHNRVAAAVSDISPCLCAVCLPLERRPLLSTGRQSQSAIFPSLCICVQLCLLMWTRTEVCWN